jgi:hypothetical protein
LSVESKRQTDAFKSTSYEKNTNPTNKHKHFQCFDFFDSDKTFISALEEMQYIQYSSEVQWKKFEGNVQEIQMLEFQTEVFEVLELHILPQLFTYNTQDPTFPKLYRTLCSLCNLARLTSPIIIKSC